MDKKSIMKTLVIFIGLLIFSLNADSQCVPAGPDQVKSLLGDYRYGASDVSEIENNTSEKTKEIGLAIFAGIKYRVIFNTTDLPDGTVIKVFKKKITKENRGKPLFDSQHIKPDSDSNLVFEFENVGRRIYIDYILPANSGPGCALVVIGQRIIPGFNTF